MVTLAALSKLQLRQNRPFDAAATMGTGPQSGGLKSRILRGLYRVSGRLLRQ